MKIILITIVLIMIASCSAEEFVINMYPDKDNPGSIIYNSSEFLLRESFPNEGLDYKIYLGLSHNSANIENKIIFNFNIIVSYPLQADQIKFFIDGESILFDYFRPPYMKREGVIGVSETLSLSVSEARVIQILNAQTVSIDIVGAHATIKLDMPELFYFNLEKFYNSTKAKS